MLLKIESNQQIPDGAVIVSHPDDANPFHVVKVDTVPEGYESNVIETTAGLYQPLPDDAKPL